MKKDVFTSTETSMFQPTSLHRRKFLAQLGIASVTVAGLAACTKTTPDAVGSISSVEDANATLPDDIAILNYAYLLEQLEAAFYIMVTTNWYTQASPFEKARFEQIRDHEIAHREFFKTALGSSANSEAQFDFSSINFNARSSVLAAAQTFEDTGVGAYNGIGYAIQNPDYLLIAGKIVSVEARHAAFIRDLVKPVSFADSSIIGANGLDQARSPTYVMQAVSPFIKH